MKAPEAANFPHMILKVPEVLMVILLALEVKHGNTDVGFHID